MTPLKPLMWKIEQSAGENGLDVYFYGDIQEDEDGWFGKIESETSANTFVKKLQEAGDVSQINVYINTRGGDAFEGVAIYNHLIMHPANTTAYITGQAASAGSVIAMGCNKVMIGRNASLFIHKPWTWAVGNDDELRTAADELEKISVSSMQSYLQKSGGKLSEERLAQIYEKGERLTAEEAMELGLVDGFIDPEAEETDGVELRAPQIPKAREQFAAMAMDCMSAAQSNGGPEPKKEIDATRIASFMGAFFMPKIKED